MNPMKNYLLLSFLLFSTLIIAQEFNGYKYIIVSIPDYGLEGKDINGLGSDITTYLRKKDYQVIYGNDEKLFPNELKFNSCLGLFVKISHPSTPPFEVTFNFVNCKNETIKEITGKASANFENAMNRVYKQFDNIELYNYNSSLTPKIDYPEVENINKSEAELKLYYDLNKLDPIEGIYKSYKMESNYKLGIIKVDDIYKAIILESDLPQWKKGDVKSVLETSAVDGVYSAKYYLGNKTSIETFANLDGGLITVEFKNQDGSDNNIRLLKLYPKK